MNQPASPATEHIDRYLVDGPIWLGISRGIAGFFGLVCLLDAFRALIINQPGADFGWIDLSPFPSEAARGLLAFAGVSLLLFGLTHRLPGIIRTAAIVGVMSLIAVAVSNAISIHRSIGQGTLRDGIPMPAHLVTLLLPVIFGIIRGRQYGPLRFPTGGAILLLSFVAAGVGFSVGYVSSLSKFHLPQPSDTVVLMHPQSETTELSQHITIAQDLVKAGYSGLVVVVKDEMSMVPALVPGEVQRLLPAGTEVSAVSVESEQDLRTALGDTRRAAVMLIGDRREAARMRLLGQQWGDRVSFVIATERAIDESIVDDVKQLWATWLSPLQSRIQRKMLAKANQVTQPQ